MTVLEGFARIKNTNLSSIKSLEYPVGFCDVTEMVDGR